jgi:hypothetical protein
MCVHALHAVHALPDLRIAAGRLRDGVSICRMQPYSWRFFRSANDLTELPHKVIQSLKLNS